MLRVEILLDALIKRCLNVRFFKILEHLIILVEIHDKFLFTNFGQNNLIQSS